MTTTHTQPAGCDLDSLQRYYVGEMGAYPMQTGEYVKFADVQAAARAAQAPQGDTRRSVEDELTWHKEALAAVNGKLKSVWKGIEEAIEKYSGVKCEGEPFDRLDELLSRLATPAAHTCTPTDERAPIGYITTGDVEHTSEGAEIGGWDIDWDHKVIDAMEEFAVPEATYAVYLEPAPRAAQGAGTAPVGAEPVAEKWAIYYDNLGNESYATGFMRPWKFYDSEEAAQGEINSWSRAKEHYKPVKVYVYATHPAPVSTAAAPEGMQNDIDMVRGALDLCEPEEQQAFQRILAAMKGANHG